MTSAGTGVVGLCLGGNRPPQLDLFVHALGRRMPVINVAGSEAVADWVLVFRSPVAVPPDVPSVWVVADRSDVEQVRRPSLVLGWDAALLDAVPTAAPRLLAPKVPVEFPDALPYAPFPRDRLRRARGLPPVAVAELTADGLRWNGTAVGPHLRATILSTASAVVADATAAVEALAYGAPLVTDAATAADLGARPGTHLLTGADAEERLRRAQELAADPILAARLSWAARTLFEERHSLAHLIANVIGAVQPINGPADRIGRVLEQLGTPADAPVRARAAAFYQFPPAPRAIP